LGTEPLITVIMPIRNEEAFIAQSLGAILNQDYPQDRLEILIADGLSDDRTLDVIRSLPGSDRVRIIPNPRRTQAAGMNAAIPQARGEFILRVDGHTVIAPDYVRACVTALQTTRAENVGGPMDMVGITPMGRAIAAASKSVFAVPGAFHVSQQAQYADTVYLGAWPRQVFERIGRFNEQVGVNEDYELNYRIRQAGGKIYFSPTIRSRYFGRQSLTALARQYFRYGRSKLKMLRAHPESLRPRQLTAPIFVAGLLAGIPLAAISPSAGIVWLSGILAYAALNLIFSISAARQTVWQLVWRIPLVFLTIHLCWGMGFWVEVFNPG
jgi:glycosyltransferase involved in cell wall biosynthesis